MYEEAFLNGFMDASSLKARKNPYPANSIEAAEYDRGYTQALCELDEM